MMAQVAPSRVREVAPAEEQALLPAIEISYRDAARTGLIGGLTAVFVSAIGMLEAFASKAIVSGLLSMGHALLLLVPLISGYLAGREPPVLEGFAAPEKGRRNVIASLIAGSLTGGTTAVFVLLATLIGLDRLREVFLNVSPGLMDLLTFGRGLGLGLPLLVAVGAVVGTIGGTLQILPDRWRRGLLGAFAWLLLIGLLEEMIKTLLRGLGLNFLVRPLFAGTGGLTVLGAGVVAALAFADYYFLADRTREWRERYEALPTQRKRNVRLGLVALAALFLAALPQVLGPFMSEVLDLVGIFLLMGLGLNIVVGFAGLLDLGYVAFFAVGAYTTAVLTSPASPQFAPELTFWAALPFVMLAAALAGIIVGAPVLRMRGDYLAIVTLGFGEIARLVLLSDWFRPILGGAQGILKIPPLSIGPLSFRTPVAMFYPIIAFCLLAVYVSYRLKDSRIGRAWMAMREDEQVAEAMGVSIVEAKLKAFITGAILASFGGALFAVKIGSVFPHSFALLVSITVLVLIIVGGMGSIPGVVVGALALVGLPELLREFEEFRLLAYGVLLILMMLYRPEGLIPSKQWARELHEEELLQDAWLKRQEEERRAAEEPAEARG